MIQELDQRIWAQALMTYSNTFSKQLMYYFIETTISDKYVSLLLNLLFCFNISQMHMVNYVD